MKKIIDSDTGEILDVEEENELVEKKLFEVGAIDEYTMDFIEQYLTIVEKYEMFKHVLYQAMKENNIKTWKNDYFTASIKDESIQKRVDNDRLKADGLYEKYLKLVPVKESLQIKMKGNKNGRE